MVMRAGLSKELGPIAYGENEEEVFLGRSVANNKICWRNSKKSRPKIKNLLNKATKEQKKVLSEKKMTCTN